MRYRHFPKPKNGAIQLLFGIWRSGSPCLNADIVKHYPTSKKNECLVNSRSEERLMNQADMETAKCPQKRPTTSFPHSHESQLCSVFKTSLNLCISDSIRCQHNSRRARAAFQCHVYEDRLGGVEVEVPICL